VTVPQHPHLGTAEISPGASCHTRAKRGSQQRSTGVSPDHSWPQVKAGTKAALWDSQAQDQTQAPPADLAPGSAPGPGPDSWWVTRGVGIPSRRRRRRSGLGGRCPGRSSHAVLHLAHWPRSAPRQARRRDGIPTPHPRPAASQHPACAISVPLTPVNHGQQRDPVTQPNHRWRLLTAQWAQPSKLGLTLRSRSKIMPSPCRETSARRDDR
jgi:hypothetical protein